MDNPGAIPLTFACTGALSVVGPGVSEGDWVEGLDGMESATIQANFAYGQGGASVVVFIQTSLDQGATPIDIAAFEFTTASDVAIVNLSALASVTTPVTPDQQQLTPGTTVNGVLGDRLRAVAVVTGTYAASTSLNVTAVVR